MATLRQAHALFLSTIISATPTGVRVTAPLAMQHGKSEVAALVGVGVLGVGAFAVIKGIKGFFTVAAKVGVSSVGKVGAGTLGNAAFGTVGKVGAGTLGKVGAGTLGKTAVGAAGARGGVKAYADGCAPRH